MDSFKIKRAEDKIDVAWHQLQKALNVQARTSKGTIEKLENYMKVQLGTTLINTQMNMGQYSEVSELHDEIMQIITDNLFSREEAFQVQSETSQVPLTINPAIILCQARNIDPPSAGNIALYFISAWLKLNTVKQVQQK